MWEEFGLLLLALKIEEGRCELTLKGDNSPQLIANKKPQEYQSYNCNGLNASNNLNERGTVFSPRILRKEMSFINTLIVALWEILRF